MRRPGITIITVIAVIVMLSMAAPAALSAPQVTTSVQATADTYIDKNDPASNLDAQALAIQQNLVDANSPDQIVLLQFDLSSVSFAISKARLNLAVMSGGCGVTSDVIGSNVYDTGAFTANTVTYNTRPTRGTLRDSVDEVTYTPPVHLHWTDTGSDSLASYLEAQRLLGQPAYLWVEPAGTGIGVVWFEDVEGTGAGLSCTGADLSPTLQLASSDSPLAVTLSTFRAADSGPNWPLAAGLVGLLGVALSVSIVLRRRYAVRQPDR